MHDTQHAQWPPDIVHSRLHLRNYARNFFVRVFDYGLFYKFVRGYWTGTGWWWSKKNANLFGNTVNCVYFNAHRDICTAPTVKYRELTDKCNVVFRFRWLWLGFLWCNADWFHWTHAHPQSQSNRGSYSNAIVDMTFGIINRSID